MNVKGTADYRMTCDTLADSQIKNWRLEEDKAMTTNSIDTNKTSLELMLRDISVGKTQLPDFQREWRWRDQQIKSLLASVSIGIPIGALLTLEGNEQLAPRPFAGVEGDPSPTDAKVLVLDGQQRLTALYQACFSKQPVSITTRKNVTEREYYFDIKECLNEEADREDCVFPETPNGRHRDKKTQYEEEVFPASEMFNFREWRDDFLEYHDHDDNKRAIANQFEDAVVRKFERYDLPTIQMKGNDLETICITFEKTNDKGTRLDAFEIITAKLKREGFDLKENWEAQRKRLHAEPVMARIEETHYLKAVTLLATLAAGVRVSARRKDMLGLNKGQYEAYSEKTTEGFIRGARQLNELGITTSKDLTNIPHAIVMAAVFAHSGDETNTIRARDNFKRWYWTTVLNESYGSRVTDEQIAADFVKLIKALPTTNGNQDLLNGGRPFDSSRLSHDRQKTLTIAIQNMLAKEKQTKDWIKGRPMDGNTGEKSEMHHIFPKKWCIQNKIAEAKRESVANLSLIDANTNNIIGGKAPSKYLPELQKKAGITEKEMNDILESHLIPIKALREDNFEKFHFERAENLKQMVSEIIGNDKVI